MLPSCPAAPPAWGLLAWVWGGAKSAGGSQRQKRGARSGWRRGTFLLTWQPLSPPTRLRSVGGNREGDPVHCWASSTSSGGGTWERSSNSSGTPPFPFKLAGLFL